MSMLGNPHDRFFKEVFSHPEAARDFLQNYLPPAVVAALNLQRLELQKESFIDEDLREQQSDMLYRTETTAGNEALVYVLLEHKSYADPLTPFQLLRYMVRIWERDLRDPAGNRTLRPIVPQVIYHGRERLPADTSFAGLYAGPEVLRSYWPAFSYELSDLSAYSDEEIVGEASVQLGLRFMKHVFDDDLEQKLPAMLALMHQLSETKTALAFLHTVLRYLSMAAGQLSAPALVETVRSVFKAEGSEIMQTIAEQWIEQGKEQGIEQGLEQGIEQGARISLLDLLSLRFGELPANLLDRLAGIHDVDSLRRLLLVAAIAETLADFEAALP